MQSDKNVFKLIIGSKFSFFYDCMKPF